MKISCWSFNLDLSFCLWPLCCLWYGSHDSACPFPDGVSLNFISCIFNFRVPFRICLILWPFPGLYSTMPTPRPTAFTEATSCTASVSLLFPAPWRCLRSSSARLWWRLNSSLSTSIFLIVSHVCQFESIFKSSFLLLNSFSVFWYLPPHLLQIISRSPSGFYQRAYPLQIDGSGFEPCTITLDELLD